jgi:hypothetical protein
MNKSFIKIGMASVIVFSAIVPSTAAFARHRHYEPQYQGYYDDAGYNRDREYRNYDRGNRDYDYDRGYRDQRCSKGTGGLIIGAIAGGLLGREVVGRRGDRTAGTILGAGVGALAGRAIDKGSNRRC